MLANLSSLQQTLEKYSKLFENLNIRIYSQQFNEDLLLFKWWMFLTETGDIKKLVSPDSYRLFPFLSIYQPPAHCIYALDKNGEIDYVLWLRDPQGTAIFAGVWARENIRSTKRIIKLCLVTYSLTFEFYESILGLTWQLDLLKLHTKIGYNIVGNLANFMHQPNAYFVQLTRSDFQNSPVYRVGGKLL